MYSILLGNIVIFGHHSALRNPEHVLLAFLILQPNLQNDLYSKYELRLDVVATSDAQGPCFQ